MNDWTWIKKSVTPLNVILFLSVSVSLIYISFYILQIMTGVASPKISESYIEDQVRSSFKANKFDAKVEDPKIENNLFHPDRKMLKRAALTSANQPRMILYGTFITQDLQMAYLEDLESPRISNTGVRRQQALLKGDAISGFVLQDIRPDKVLLVRDQERIWIRIDDKKPPRENDVTAQELPPPLPAPEKNKPQMSK
jgi:hypothetical protein